MNCYLNTGKIYCAITYKNDDVIDVVFYS